jgi:hypothetical protein
MAKDPKESLVAPVRSDDLKPSDKKNTSEDGLNGKQVAKKLNDNKNHDQELVSPSLSIMIFESFITDYQGCFLLPFTE